MNRFPLDPPLKKNVRSPDVSENKVTKNPKKKDLTRPEIHFCAVRARVRDSSIITIIYIRYIYTCMQVCSYTCIGVIVNGQNAHTSRHILLFL